MSRYNPVDGWDFWNDMNYQQRDISRVMTRRLAAWADPNCPECNGEGIVCFTSRQQADGYIDVACACTKAKREAENGPDGDHDPDGPFGAGFTENH